MAHEVNKTTSWLLFSLRTQLDHFPIFRDSQSQYQSVTFLITQSLSRVLRKFSMVKKKKFQMELDIAGNSPISSNAHFWPSIFIRKKNLITFNCFHLQEHQVIRWLSEEDQETLPYFLFWPHFSPITTRVAWQKIAKWLSHKVEKQKHNFLSHFQQIFLGVFFLTRNRRIELIRCLLINLLIVKIEGKHDYLEKWWLIVENQDEILRVKYTQWKMFDNSAKNKRKIYQILGSVLKISFIDCLRRFQSFCGQIGILNCFWSFSPLCQNHHFWRV